MFRIMEKDLTGKSTHPSSIKKDSDFKAFVLDFRIIYRMSRQVDIFMPRITHISVPTLIPVEGAVEEKAFAERAKLARAKSENFMMLLLD